MNKWTVILLLLLLGSCGTTSFHRKKHGAVRKIRVAKNQYDASKVEESVEVAQAIEYQNEVTPEETGEPAVFDGKTMDADTESDEVIEDLEPEGKQVESVDLSPTVPADSTQVYANESWFNRVHTRKQANLRLLLAGGLMLASIGAIIGAFIFVDIVPVSIIFYVLSFALLFFAGFAIVSYFAFRVRVGKGEKPEKRPTFLGILAAVYLSFGALGFAALYIVGFIEQFF